MGLRVWLFLHGSCHDSLLFNTVQDLLQYILIRIEFYLYESLYVINNSCKCIKNSLVTFLLLLTIACSNNKSLRSDKCG